MRLYFDNDTSVDIDLYESVLKNYFTYCFKHLQHINIPTRESDSSIEKIDIESLINNLCNFAKKLGITVDKNACFSRDQLYLNYLHEIYEKKYNGNPVWMDFHRTVHLLEDYHKRTEKYRIDIHYDEKSGLLEKKFQDDLKSELVCKVKAGEVYISWVELGKRPWDYWQNNEPNDIKRICELCKPWIKVKPRLSIALIDKDLVYHRYEKLDDFLSWWNPYKEDWCNYWNLKSWHWQDMFSVIPIGYVKDLDTLITADNNGALPKQIKLDSSSDQKEKLKFELDITATWESHEPSLEIYINNHFIKIAKLEKGRNRIKFDYALDFQHHTLNLKKSGATNKDNTQLLTIDAVSIDNISCDQLILFNSYFEPIYPEPWASEQKQNHIKLPEKIPFETVMGHDGTWTMDFSCPFYPHVLEYDSKSF